MDGEEELKIASARREERCLFPPVVVSNCKCEIISGYANEGRGSCLYMRSRIAGSRVPELLPGEEVFKRRLFIAWLLMIVHD